MIYKKREQWCFRDESGTLHKFDSEIAAKLAYEKIDAPKEVQADIEQEEEENSEELEALFYGESSSEEEI